VATYLSESLGSIGAIEHKKLFDYFIAKNQIDLFDLSSFDSDEDESESRLDTFDAFDEVFYDLGPLEKFLIPYIRQYITEV